MGLESVNHISDLNTSNPTISDGLSQGDDHIRNIKTALKTDFPNINGVVSASDEDLSACAGFSGSISSDGTTVTIPTAKFLDIIDAGGLKIGSVAVTITAAEANLNDGAVAGTIVNSKTVVYGAAGEVNATTLQIAGTSITATATELNYADGPNAANKFLLLDGSGLIPYAQQTAGVLLNDSVTGIVSSLAATTWSSAQTEALTSVSTVYGITLGAGTSGTKGETQIIAVDSSGYVYGETGGSAGIPTLATPSAGNVNIYVYNASGSVRDVSYIGLVTGV